MAAHSELGLGSPSKSTIYLVRGWLLGIEGFASAASVPTPLGLALELGWGVSVAVIGWRMPVQMTTAKESAGDEYRGGGPRK